MIRQFCYSKELIAEHQGLHSMVLFVDGVTMNTTVNSCVTENIDVARRLLSEMGSESQIESIKQWRLAYRKFHTDPTKFRMAAESILRRLRTSGDFTDTLHPLVVLCNSFSARFAVPVAALDAYRIDGRLHVCSASGESQYTGFDDSCLLVPAGEVTFEDDAGRAHARKWSHKQSSYSAVRSETTKSIIVAEALHSNAKSDLSELFVLLNRALLTHWPNVKTAGKILSGEDLVKGIFNPFSIQENDI